VFLLVPDTDCAPDNNDDDDDGNELSFFRTEPGDIAHHDDEIQKKQPTPLSEYEIKPINQTTH
jgi:hypothetical protein